MFVADRKAVRGGSMRKLAVVEPGRRLISSAPADIDRVALLSRQVARRSMGAAHDVRSHLKT
jgi:hypothetical protein